jgi:hypothetical protein
MVVWNEEPSELPEPKWEQVYRFLIGARRRLCRRGYIRPEDRKINRQKRIIYRNLERKIRLFS